jgi:hypothetical protein
MSYNGDVIENIRSRPEFACWLLHGEISNTRSHRLKPGIASFSNMMGSRTTIARNDTNIPIIHRQVHARLRLLGGVGSGFKSALLVICRDGTGMGGSGFGGSILFSFGGTVGLWPYFGALRSRTPALSNASIGII